MDAGLFAIPPLNRGVPGGTWEIAVSKSEHVGFPNLRQPRRRAVLLDQKQAARLPRRSKPIRAFSLVHRQRQAVRIGLSLPGCAYAF